MCYPYNLICFVLINNFLFAIFLFYLTFFKKLVIADNRHQTQISSRISCISKLLSRAFLLRAFRKKDIFVFFSASPLPTQDKFLAFFRNVLRIFLPIWFFLILKTFLIYMGSLGFEPRSRGPKPRILAKLYYGPLGKKGSWNVYKLFLFFFFFFGLFLLWLGCCFGFLRFCSFCRRCFWNRSSGFGGGLGSFFLLFDFFLFSQNLSKVSI